MIDAGWFVFMCMGVIVLVLMGEARQDRKEKLQRKRKEQINGRA